MMDTHLQLQEEHTHNKKSDSNPKVASSIIPKEMIQRWKDRQKRTLPPPTLSSNPHHYVSSHAPSPLFMQKQEDLERVEFCNPYPAQPTTKNRDFAFYSRQNKQKKQPRILILGILNSVGYNLALKLHHECHVHVIMGMDMMIPNTLSQRTIYLQRANALKNQIPSLQHYLSINVPTTLQYHPSFTKADQNRLHKFQEPYQTILNTTHELNLVHAFDPTHIIHVATYQPYTQDYHHRTLPYFPIQHNLATLEYILSSIAHIQSDSNTTESNPQKPHLTYLTAVPKTISKDDVNFWGVAKQMEQVLISTYSNLYHVSSIGLQVDSIYGPMTSTMGSVLHQYASLLVSPFCWEQRPSNRCQEEAFRTHYQTNHPHDSSKIHNYVYVDDVANAILLAMQYPPQKSMILNIASNDNYSREQLFQKMLQLRPSQSESNDWDQNINQNHTSMFPSANDILGWEATTSIHHGLANVLAWHLDQNRPFQYKYPLVMETNTDDKRKRILNLSLETGNQFLIRRNLPLCGIEDNVCLRDKFVFPCMSECSDELQCRKHPSIHESFPNIIRQKTEHCYIVVYATIFHSKENERTTLPNIQTSEEENFDPRTVCYIAFISKDVQSNMDTTTNDVIEPSSTGKNDSLQSEIVSHHNEWMIITVPSTGTTFSVEDELLFKLSPTRLFSSKVRYGVYVTVSQGKRVPGLEDIYFLVDRMRKSASPAKVLSKPSGHGFQMDVDYPPIPELRSILLANSMFVDDTDLSKSVLSLTDAIQRMKETYNFDPDMEDATHRKNIMKQKTFYEYFISKMSRNDLRSNEEPKYVFELKHWITGLGIVHDFRREEARQFRCEWYQEQLQHQNKLDQLGFAMVMARREMHRKLLRQEPDKFEMEQMIKQYTILDEVRDHTSPDLREWFSLPGTHETPHYKNIPFPILKQDEIQYSVPESYVRITNNKSMTKELEKWTKIRFMWKEQEKAARKKTAPS